MSSVVALASESTIVVQMLAFSEPEWQLRRYIETMNDAGLDECFLFSLKGQRDGRLWRSVPGRRWYSDQRGETPGSQEVVLLHKKRINAQFSQQRTAGRGSPTYLHHFDQCCSQTIDFT